jgi:predicted small lipoprotein YifL
MPKILGAALLVLLAAACGQKGDLYYAKDAAARNRASLGQALRPSMPASATPAPEAVDLPSLTPATQPLPLPSN